MPDIKDLINLAVDDQGVHFVELTHDLLQQKALDHLDTFKIVVAQNMFNNEPVSEEVLDELSKKTLGSYINKAADSAAVGHANRLVARKNADHVDQFLNTNDISHTSKSSIRHATRHFRDQEEEGLVQSIKRITGIKRAVNQLTKEELEEAKKIEPTGMAIHLNSTSKKRGGLPLYKVHAVGEKVKKIKAGSHLTDPELDDLTELGHKIKVLD